MPGTFSHTPHAVVIGAGFGGLAAAVRLRSMGYRVTMLEATEQLGGRGAVWKRDGFSFDAGPTVITAPYLFDELWEMTGRKAEDYFTLKPVDPFYRVKFDDGSSFDYVGEEDRLLANIAAFSPGDVEGYQKMADHSRRIFEIGYQQLAHTPFTRLTDMLRVIPDMLKLENHLSVYSLVSRYIKDERLRQVFTFQPLLIGGNPYNCSSIYMLIHWLERKWGVHYAMGGTASIVAAFGRLLDELEVDIQLNTPVENIEVSGGKVRAVWDGHGRRHACDIVVSNADPSMVYTKMIDKKHRRKNRDWLIKMKKQSMSLFVAYFGTDKLYPDVAHHSILLGPRYKELLEDIFERKILAEDFSLYLHRPTASDPNVAPEGHEAFYVLSPVPNNRSGIDWEHRHEEYLNRIMNALEEICLPDLNKHTVTKFAVDPRYFQHRLRSYDGAAFGLEPRLSQSAYMRYHNASPDVQDLYFVGASTHPGAGVPGVLSGAKVLDTVVPQVASRAQMPMARPNSRMQVA